MISREKMLVVYSTMVRCRAVAEATERTARDARGLANGWEATAAGVLGALLPEDTVIAPRGSPIEEILRAARAEGGAAQDAADGASRKESAKKGRDEADGAVVSAMGDEFDAARQAAGAFHAAKNERVAVLFRKAPFDTENWRTRLPDVAQRNLPLLIVSYLEATATGRKTFAREQARNHATGTLVFGVPVLTVDGGDALAVYRVASEAVFRARQRRGPTLIECAWFPVPSSMDVTAQDGRGTADPILNLERSLVAKGILTPALKSEIDRTLRFEPDASASRIRRR